jgi:hypothetical protein
MARYKPKTTLLRTGIETGLTEQVTDAAVLLIREGVKPVRALMTLGAAQSSISKWRAKAREGIEPYKERIERIDIAEALFLGEVEIHLGAEARTGDWRASMAMLTKRLSTEYGDKVTVHQEELQSGATALTDEQLDEQLKARGIPPLPLVGASR